MPRPPRATRIAIMIRLKNEVEPSSLRTKSTLSPAHTANRHPERPCPFVRIIHAQRAWSCSTGITPRKDLLRKESIWNSTTRRWFAKHATLL